MPTIAIKPYEFAPADSADRFHGLQVLYVGWEDHLMFCAPFAFLLPPDMPFSEVIAKPISDAFAYHPEFSRINWSEVQWLKSGQPWTPDPAKSLAENGLRHKDSLKFRTPGLNGLMGASF
jgi:phenol hydroxylase P4 protein